MFSLRESTSIASSGIDEDPFGWWIGIEPDTSPISQNTKVIISTRDDDQQTRQQPRSMSPETSCAASLDSGCPAPSRPTDSDAEIGDAEEEEDEEEEHIELRVLSAPDKARSDRNAVCYTPERLVKREEYRIRTPSPRFSSSFADLENARLRLVGAGPETELHNGAARLARLLQSGINDCQHCCPVRYGNGEVLLHTDNCNKNDLSSSSSQNFETTTTMTTTNLNQETKTQTRQADDSSGISSVDGLAGIRPDDWSCSNSNSSRDDSCGDREIEELEKSDGRIVGFKRISDDEFTCASLDDDDDDDDDDDRLANFDDKVEITESLASQLQSKLVILNDSSCTEHRNKSFQRIQRRSSRNNQCKTDKSRIKIVSQESELEIERLRWRIDQLQGNNKILYEEITSLRRDFAIDECKVNHLSEDVSRLHNEVHELRYLDDLLKLLKGELERISKRSWPFAIGNTKRGTEEINLVV